jgi:predicted dinucleotide-binding enzyme
MRFIMKIGILGSGDVGRRLDDGFIELGHTVKASSGTFAETASFGELDMLATLWAGSAIKMGDPKNLAEKVVIDVTNPLDFPKGMPPRLAIGHTDSAGETVQRMLPDSKVIKGFNIVGNVHMIHPDFPGGPPTMFIFGNDEDAKKTRTDNILTKFGWETIDIGGIEGARLKPIAFLWIMHALRTVNGNHAFKLLRK